MSIKYSTRLLYLNMFHIYPNWYFWFENKPSCSPARNHVKKICITYALCTWAEDPPCPSAAGSGGRRACSRCSRWRHNASGTAFRSLQSGVDVVITIFGNFRQFSEIFDNFLRFSTIFWDFRQFSAIFFEKIGVFLKNQWYDQTFA
jgi:hypothetical protein